VLTDPVARVARSHVTAAGPAYRMRIPIFIALATVAACSGGTGDLVPSGATCPPGSTLTYDNFAKPFMEAYCTSCHASDLHGADRHGAPVFHDFDTERGILNVHDHVDEQAAAGPENVNKWMPRDNPKPTDAERYQLGEWLACAVAAIGHPDARLFDAMPDADFVTPDAAIDAQ